MAIQLFYWEVWENIVNTNTNERINVYWVEHPKDNSGIDFNITIDENLNPSLIINPIENSFDTTWFNHVTWVFASLWWFYNDWPSTENTTLYIKLYKDNSLIETFDYPVSIPWNWWTYYIYKWFTSSWLQWKWSYKIEYLHLWSVKKTINLTVTSIDTWEINSFNWWFGKNIINNEQWWSVTLYWQDKNYDFSSIYDTVVDWREYELIYNDNKDVDLSQLEKWKLIWWCLLTCINNTTEYATKEFELVLKCDVTQEIKSFWFVNPSLNPWESKAYIFPVELDEFSNNSWYFFPILYEEWVNKWAAWLATFINPIILPIPVWNPWYMWVEWETLCFIDSEWFKQVIENDWWNYWTWNIWYFWINSSDNLKVNFISESWTYRKTINWNFISSWNIEKKWSIWIENTGDYKNNLCRLNNSWDKICIT